MDGLLAGYGFTTPDSKPLFGFELTDDVMDLINVETTTTEVVTVSRRPNVELFMSSDCHDIKGNHEKSDDPLSDFLLPCSRILSLGATQGEV